MKFSDDTKKPMGNYFGEGVHEVEILDVTGGKTDDGKEYFEFKLGGENGEEGTARLWWTDKASQFSFNTVKNIFVHNTVEKNRDKMRETVDAQDDTDALLKLCKENLVGKQAWYLVEKTDRTYLKDGETKFSYNRNIYGYRPTPKKVTVDDIIPGGQAVDANEVPFE